MTTNRLTDCLVFYAHASVIKEIRWTLMYLLLIGFCAFVVWRFTRRDK